MDCLATRIPIGKRIAQVDGGKLQWGEIVGVARDVKPVVADPSPVVFQVYEAMEQQPRARNEIAVRVYQRRPGRAPSAMVESIRTTMAELDPDLPVRTLQAADATIDRANYQPRVLRDMLTGFGILGLGLASLGIYGIISRTMAQRAGEFAIRLALGACVRDLTRIVLTSGVKLALVGSAVGLLGAMGVVRLLAATSPGMRIDGLPVLIGDHVSAHRGGVGRLLASRAPRRAGRCHVAPPLGMKPFFTQRAWRMNTVSCPSTLPPADSPSFSAPSLCR